MGKFILKKGDYIDLREFGLQERKDIQSWLEYQGNIFFTTKSMFDTETKFLEYMASGEVAKARYLSRFTTNNRTKELIEAMIEAMSNDKQQLPEAFIIVNADKPEVRQWLKDLGYKWCNGLDLTNSDINQSVLACFKGSNGTQYSSLEFYKREYPNIPIITPRIGVTGFDIEQPNPNQAEIERMKKNIEELQESIKKLEGK